MSAYFYEMLNSTRIYRDCIDKFGVIYYLVNNFNSTSISSISNQIDNFFFAKIRIIKKLDIFIKQEAFWQPLLFGMDIGYVCEWHLWQKSQYNI